MHDNPELINRMLAAGLKLDVGVEDKVHRIQGVFSSETFALLDQFPALTSLNCEFARRVEKNTAGDQDVPIQDKDLEVLSRCSRLAVLSLKGASELTDAGLVHLQGLVHVWSLTLPRNITDEGLRQLDTLTGLCNLNLDVTKASGVGVKYLQNLPLFEHISRWNGDVDDEAMQAMVTLPHIQRIFLTGSQVRDESLRHLADANSLCEFFLNDTSITDDAIEHLCRTPDLRGLWVDGTYLTPAGVARLRAGLPNTDIYAGSPDDPPQP